jgi:hypothetical protein
LYNAQSDAKLKASHPSLPFALHLTSSPGARSFIWRCTSIGWNDFVRSHIW